MADGSDMPPEDYKAFAVKMAADAGAQDKADYDNATSGANVGRQDRHGSKGEVDPVTGERKGSAAQSHARDLQWFLANDQIFAQAHQSAMREVTATFALAHDVMERLLLQKMEIAQDIEKALDDAPTLLDGRKVFRDENGVVWDEHGKMVDADSAAGIQWTGNEPSYEHYRSLLEQRAKNEAAIERVKGAENRLGDLHTELTRDDPPVTLPRIKDIEDEADDIEKDLKEIEASAGLTISQAPAVESDKIVAPTSVLGAALPQIQT